MKLSKIHINIIILTASLLLINCKKESLNSIKTNKANEYLLEVHYELPFFQEIISFKIKDDSTYIYSKKNEHDDSSSITFTGKLEIKNDTIFFLQNEFEINKAKKAVLKNNLIVFLNDEHPYRLPINKTKLAVKNHYNLNQFKNYSTFNSHEYLLQYYYTKPFIDYELQNNDMILLDEIVQKIFKENKDKLRPYTDYIIQCCAIKSKNNEIEVLTNIYCYDEIFGLSYKLGVKTMNDGGNCNVSVHINLSKKTYSELNIAGLANGD